MTCDNFLHCLNKGYVTDRRDPEKLGRVRFCIPGYIEPDGPWARPLGTLGGGSKDCGAFFVPEVNAEVGIFFLLGCRDAPYYFAGDYGKPGGISEVPEEAQANSPDNRVIATPHFRFEMNEAPGNRYMRFSDRKSGCRVTIDAEKNLISVEAPTAITIKTPGTVDIDATQIRLNGRVVRAVRDAI